MESNANVGQVVEDFDVVAFEHVIGDVIELGDDGRLEVRLGLVEELRIEIEIDLRKHKTINKKKYASKKREKMTKINTLCRCRRHWAVWRRGVDSCDGWRSGRCLW